VLKRGRDVLKKPDSKSGSESRGPVELAKRGMVGAILAGSGEVQSA
jgi:hypothetical protein